MSNYNFYDISGNIKNKIHYNERATHRMDKYIITEEFDKKYFDRIRKNIQISQFSIIKQDIQNYNKLSDFQLEYLKKINENEKIEIIKMYNSMISTIHQLLDI